MNKDIFLLSKWILLLFFITTHLIAADPISKEEVLAVAKETKQKIESINGYQFLLVKRELVDGKDTGHQYIDVKVRTEPLAIYVKFLKPAKYAGREALYFKHPEFGTDELVVRRGGTRMPNMVLHITPESPLAMDGNRYPITHMNPKVLANELMTKIEKELAFPETKLEVYRQAKVFDQPGTHYRMTHTSQEDGMECYIAEVMICKTLGVPIYFRVIDFNKHLLEEYAFKGMVLNPNFTSDEFDEGNPEYGFAKEDGQD
jgi:hypothetical protein